MAGVPQASDTMHARPPQARTCKGIAETWLVNMAGVPQAIGYGARAPSTGTQVQRHCWNMAGKHGTSLKGNGILCSHSTKQPWRSHYIQCDLICWQITIAALMQPHQYNLQCPAAKDNSNHSITHAAAAPSNIHAAITMHFAAWRGWQHQMTTIMQPFQCDLQPQVQETNRTHTHKNHALQNTEEEPITLGTTPAATAPHRRYLSSPAAATLHGKTQGFVLRLPPQHKLHATCNIHAANTMHFAAWRG